MVNLQNYYKKKEDKFDKIGYLSDMFKLMQEHLDKINRLIDENEKQVREEEEAENIRKKLKFKHSVHEKLKIDGKLAEIAKLKEDVNKILENLRTPDGRTLKEIYN